MLRNLDNMKMTRRAGLCPSKSNNETDQTARPMAKRLSMIYDNSFEFLMRFLLDTVADIPKIPLNQFIKLPENVLKLKLVN